MESSFILSRGLGKGLADIGLCYGHRKVLLKRGAALQESEYNHHEHHDKQQVDQAATDWDNEGSEQPQEDQDQDDRFQRITRHDSESPLITPLWHTSQ